MSRYDHDMHHVYQEEIISTLGVKPEIDPAAEVEQRVAFLYDYAKATGTHGYVLGISGGVDSTLGGRLAQLAAERLRAEGSDPDAKFIAMRLPYGDQRDEHDAKQAIEWMGADERIVINIKGATTSIEAAYLAATGLEISDFNKGNVKARMRMISQYAVAGDRGLLVVGTDHAAENVTGFFTKHGDGAADVIPLSGLNKRQVRQLTEYLGAPENLWSKVPTADLLDADPQRSDESELGLAYDEIDDYLEGKQISDAAAAELEKKWVRSRHKRTTPVDPSDSWWRD